jgi:hypothetical protein
VFDTAHGLVPPCVLRDGTHGTVFNTAHGLVPLLVSWRLNVAVSGARVWQDAWTSTTALSAQSAHKQDVFGRDNKQFTVLIG